MEKQLSSSPEEAERFAASMKKHYMLLGLPNPVWHPKPFNPAGLKLGYQGLKYGAQALKLSGWFKLGALAVALPSLVYVSYKTYTQVTEPRPTALSAPASLQPNPVSNPAPLPPRYQQLSISVELPNSGLVTVRVFDSQSVEIKTLYAGVLPAGQKVFIWDGKKEDGALASPGTYFIQVQSGKNHMRREVHIEAD